MPPWRRGGGRPGGQTGRAAVGCVWAQGMAPSSDCASPAGLLCTSGGYCALCLGLRSPGLLLNACALAGCESWVCTSPFAQTKRAAWFTGTSHLGSRRPVQLGLRHCPVSWASPFPLSLRLIPESDRGSWSWTGRMFTVCGTLQYEDTCGRAAWTQVWLCLRCDYDMCPVLAAGLSSSLLGLP